MLNVVKYLVHQTFRPPVTFIRFFALAQNDKTG